MLFRDDVDFNDPAALVVFRDELLALAANEGPLADVYRGMAEDVQLVADGLIANTPENSSVSGLAD